MNAALKISSSTRSKLAFTLRSKIRRRRPIEILLVEDDASDALLTEGALEETHLHYNLHTLSSGSDVVPFLRKTDAYKDVPTPDIIFLDLSLPHKDGFEIMAELAMEARFQRIPIIILTGQEPNRHAIETYSVWLSDYMTKPCSSEKLMDALTPLHSPKLAG